MGSVNVDRRAERRQFIRAHHPDRGGDPEVFVAGLRRFDDQTPNGAASQNQVPESVASVSPWPVSLVTLLLREVAKWHRRVR